MGGRGDSGPSRADQVLGVGVRVRRLQLRLFTVSRFAGLLSLYILQSIH